MRFSKFILITIVLLKSGLVTALSFTVTTKIRLDVVRQTSVEEHSIGSIVLGLFGNRAQKTVANFRHLCLSGINGTTYKGSKFHRVIKHFLIHGGDIIHGNGSGSISIYGKYFDDEVFDIQHNRPGYVGMANHGPNTNGCQFYITTAAAQWLNGKHTIFGKVLEGMDTVNIIELVKTDRDDYPLETIVISNCSELSNEPFELYPDDFNVWGWIKSAGIPVGSSFIVLMILHYFYHQLTLYC